MTTLAVRPDQEAFTTTQLAALRQLGVEQATQGDLALFLSYAQKTGLDPFSRQIYMIGRRSGGGTKWTIQAGIDGLRIIAERSGTYQGQTAPEWFDGTAWRDVWMPSKTTPVPVAARVGVYRQGFRDALYATAMWSEYAVDGPMWRKMPALMLSKVAEALALRKAFPNDMSGIYSDEEMAQAQPAAVKPAPLTVEEIRLSIVMAQTDDELRACWAKARDAGALTELVEDPHTGRTMTVDALVFAARERLTVDVTVDEDGVISE